MVRFVWWIRSAFCKHDFEYEETIVDYADSRGKIVESKTVVSAICVKCSWHRKFKKF